MLYTISGSKTVVGIQSRTLRKWNVLTRKKNKWHTSILFDLAAPPHGAGAGDVSFVRLAEHWSVGLVFARNILLQLILSAELVLVRIKLSNSYINRREWARSIFSNLCDALTASFEA